MTNLRENPDIQKLPQSVQTKLFSFMDTIPKVKFFKLDGKPKKEWKIFYGDNWDAAWGAARDAAGDAARDAAWDAAGDAAGDFSLEARIIVASDLDYKDKAKHQAHVDARFEVWRKGYGLLCDVNGVLYVYAVKATKTPPTKAEKQLEAKKLKALRADNCT